MLPEQRKAFGEFYKTARHNDVLDNKTTLMLHLAASMAVDCAPCMDYYLGQVDEAGLSPDEISAVESIVMAVSAGRVRAQFHAVRSSCSQSKPRGCCED